MARKKNNTPCRKKFKRPQRLQAAKSWIGTYNGRDLVKGYAKRFGVDRMCALVELRAIGHPVTDDMIAAELKHIAAIAAQKARAAQKRAEKEDLRALDPEAEFACVIGYAFGLPYGVRYDELEDEEKRYSQSDDFDDPFA